jgi:hypothetical protein
MKMEQTVCSETSAYKIQTPGNYPEESLQHLQHGESLKSRNESMVYTYCAVMQEWLARVACGIDLVKSTNRLESKGLWDCQGAAAIE